MNTSQQKEAYTESYRESILKGLKARAKKLSESFVRSFGASAFKKMANAAEKWAGRCRELAEKAELLAKSGVSRDSLEYDELRTYAQELGGGAKTHVAEKFEETMISASATEPNAAVSAQINGIVSQRSKKFLLGEISRYAAWGKKGRAQLDACVKEIKERFPDAASEVDRRLERGKRLLQFKTQAAQHHADFAEIEAQMKEEGFFPYEITLVRKMKDKRLVKKEIHRDRYFNGKSAANAAAAKPSPMPFAPRRRSEASVSLSELFAAAIHPNSIPELAPASSWTILFDETGTEFSDRAFGADVNEISLGRMVALAVPDYARLPSCHKNFHCVDMPLSSIRKMLHSVLSNKCGVIGIPVNALSRVHSEQWFACIEILLDLILRLLPLNGETTLNVLVEQRGEAKPERSILLRKTCDDCLHRLSRAFPERSSAISIKPKIISKQDSGLNGYVDAVAFTWSSPNAKELLAETRWTNTCLFSSDAEFLRSCIDVIEREDLLKPSDWAALLVAAESGIANSIPSAMLTALGRHARVNAGYWRTLIEETVRHLDSKAININRLERQVKWLNEWQPDEASLPPRLRLLWLTVKLAEANHRGCLAQFPRQVAEFQNLLDSIYLEDAPLACFAALHLAVAKTNEFDFEEARALLEPWLEKPVAAVGLKYHGQLLSSLGQHAAFLDDQQKAAEYFRQAIEDFSRLSDSSAAARDTSQTRAYLLTAIMDDPSLDRNEIQKELRLYFGGEVSSAASVLSGSKADKDKYPHHILLRYLHSGRASKAEVDAYLRGKDQWASSDDGHPWELIEFYRGLLLAGTERGVRHLKKAWEIALADKSGPTLKVIAAVIGFALAAKGGIDVAEVEKLVEECAAQLPKLGEKRISILRNQSREPLPALDLARAVLPFNFR